MAQASQQEWTSEFDSVVHPETVWTAANIQEALPGQLSPMSWSLMRSVLDYGFSQPAKRAGVFVPTADTYVAQFYGRPFLNATAFRAWNERVPFSSAAAVDEHYLGIERADTVERGLPSLKDFVRAAPYLPRLAWLALVTPFEVVASERRVAAAEERDLRLLKEGSSPGDMVREIEEAMPLAREVAALHIGVSGGTSTAFDWLGHLTKSWLDDEDGSVLAALCTGVKGLESEAPGRALWSLAREASRTPVVAAALSRDDAAAALTELRSLPEARRFLRGYDDFARRYGHRSVMETELSARAWEDDPASVFAILRTLRDAGPESDPEAIEREQGRRYEAALKAAHARLSLPRRLLFDRVLSQTRTYIARRERTKSLLIRGLHRCRRLLRAIGRSFVADGTIANEDDVFFLTFDEVAAITRGGGGLQLSALPSMQSGGPEEGIRERIERRRAESVRNRDVVLPTWFQGRPAPIRTKSSEDGHDGPRTIKGIAVSPRRVTGRARVVMDPREDATIEQGEILVAPVTDAAWTPLFLAAAGVVVDIGGPLSHGATVARELGLPAVVNVRAGTSTIRTGQTITVDGREGWVRIEEG